MVQSMPLGPCALTNDKVRVPSRRPQNSGARGASPSRFAVAVGTIPANAVRRQRQRRHPRAKSAVVAVPANTVGRRQARPLARVRSHHVTTALSVAILLGMLFAMGWRLLAGAAAPLPAAPMAVMTVQQGDTLWSLAQRHGNPNAYILDRVDGLARANSLSPNAHLVPGQKLRVPVANPTRWAKR